MTLSALPPSGRVARRLGLLVFVLAFSVVAFVWTVVRFDLGFVFAMAFVAPVGLVIAGLCVPAPSRPPRLVAAALGIALASLACITQPAPPYEYLLSSGLYGADSRLPGSPAESSAARDLVLRISEIERRTPDYARVLVRVVSVDGLPAPAGLFAVGFFDPRARTSPGDRVSARARWRVPSGYDSPSYRRYLLGRGVYGSLSVREYQHLGEAPATLMSVFEPARVRVRQLARELYPPDTAVLALGLLA